MKVLNILLVDDDDTARAALKEYLVKKMQCNVHELSRGDAVADFLGKEKCDILILDIRLPGRSGIGVLDDIKDHLKDVFTLVVTAWDSDAVAKECANRDIECLPKPLDYGLLLDKILNHAG